MDNLQCPFIKHRIKCRVSKIPRRKSYLGGGGEGRRGREGWVGVDGGVLTVVHHIPRNRSRPRHSTARNSPTLSSPPPLQCHSNDHAIEPSHSSTEEGRARGLSGIEGHCGSTEDTQKTGQRSSALSLSQSPRCCCCHQSRLLMNDRTRLRTQCVRQDEDDPRRSQTDSKVLVIRTSTSRFDSRTSISSLN